MFKILAILYFSLTKVDVRITPSKPLKLEALARNQDAAKYCFGLAFDVGLALIRWQTIVDLCVVVVAAAARSSKVHCLEKGGKQVEHLAFSHGNSVFEVCGSEQEGPNRPNATAMLLQQ